MKILAAIKKYSRQIVFVILVLLILTSLTVLSQNNFLLYHCIAELFSISIAFGIFMVTWSARDVLDNYYMLYIGVASLFIGVLDLMHTLSFSGMGIFPGISTDIPTQLWIAARSMHAVIFIVAPTLIRRKPNNILLFLGYVITTSFFLLSIMVWKNFPVCYIDGIGLTAFKKYAEYVISLTFIGAIGLLIFHRHSFDQYVFKMLVGSLIFTVMSELLFTFYFSVMSKITVAGHLYKIIAFYFIYEAIIRTSVVNPQHILYRNLKQSEEDLRIAEARYRELFDNMSSSVYVFEAVDGGNDFIVRDVNHASQIVDEFVKEDVINRSAKTLHTGIEKTDLFQIMKQVYLTKQNIYAHELLFVTRSGNETWRDIFCYALPSDEIILIFDDVTERKKSISRLEHMASHDLLTDLPNRTLFIDRLNHAVQLTRRIGLLLTVFFIDLDNFKMINDRYGHASGDIVLVEVAKRLTGMMRRSDTVARFSGDEFVILTELTSDRDAISYLAQKILDRIKHPIEVEGGIVSLSASIGIGISPDDGLDAEELLKKADSAMYISKESGRDKFSFYPNHE